MLATRVARPGRARLRAVRRVVLKVARKLPRRVRNSSWRRYVECVETCSEHGYDHGLCERLCARSSLAKAGSPP